MTTRNTAFYLAAVKKKLNISSDYALAKALGIAKQSASRYTLGKGMPTALVCFRIAEILGDQPAAVIADIEQERAERDEAAADVEEWKGYAQRFGGRLATIGASILLVAGLGGISNADAKLAHFTDDGNSAHRMKY